MKITLLYPPLDDPTTPYHANAYLLGSLRGNGFADATMRDINIEFINYCLEKATVDRFHREREQRLFEFENRSRLSAAEQVEYLALWRYVPIRPEQLATAAQELRNIDSFLDYTRYTANTTLIIRYFSFLGSLCFPGEIENFQLRGKGRFSIYALQDLFNIKLSDSLCYCFEQFFRERLVMDPEFRATEVFGISVTYDHQLVSALWLARAIRNTWPEKRVAAGGTALSQTYKHMKNKDNMRFFFDAYDAIVVGEGETAICALAACDAEWHQEAKLPNTITYDRERDILRFPDQVHYEHVRSLRPPIFEYKWDLYLSPERGINYAPTRGCYWNRCTFCDYGLNSDRPTSPWRERAIDQVIADLREAIGSHGISYVYFAVDVMAPGYLERLSDAILDSGLKFHWSAELRMEKIFTPERCAKMAQAGCVCASFGMESGSQRVLDLIDKGTKIEFMQETMRNFAGAGIAVQLMSFEGFPSETLEEKQATVEFARRNKPYWSNGGTGKFLLTGTAIVARKPQLFGITLLSNEKVDINRVVDYIVDNAEEIDAIDAEEGDASFENNGGIFPRTRPRPWAGGIDSLHSMIYYHAYGRNFFKTNELNLPDSHPPASRQPFYLDSIVLVRGRLSYAGFNLAKLAENTRRMRTALKSRPKEGASIHIYSDFVRRDHPSAADVQADGGYWIAYEGRCVRLHESVYEAILTSTKGDITFREILARVSDEMKPKVASQLEKLCEIGMLAAAENAAILLHS